ncbi:MAG: sigma-54 dependent transcriptional regulator [Myxococcota bacterium]
MPAEALKVPARVAVVDDEPVILESWQEMLAPHYAVELFSDPLAARRFFDTEDIDVALLDVRMPGLDGLALLEHLLRVQPRAEAIVVTGHGTIQTAVQALQQGAYDFLCKPIDDLDSAVRRIESAVERKRLKEVNANLRSRLDAFGPETELIGASRSIEQVKKLVEQIANSTAPVLISGESGTGKELVARALHSRSNRRKTPFIAVNCAAMSESLIDSELFGHEKGAFTGAVGSHKGLFEAADQGVLFLDELGDVPPQTQVKLLRALQENEIRPVGSTRSRKIDVRIIAATNVDLERAMRAGTFREDLYYRISTFRVVLPPLRERRDDVPLIAQHLLDKFAKRVGNQCKTFSDDAMSSLVAYDWPGNVRELNNAVEHAATLSAAEVISADRLPSFVNSNVSSRSIRSATVTSAVGSISSRPFSEARYQLVEEFELRYLKDLLGSTEGNLSEASRRSGIDRSNLRRMLKRYGIKAASFRPGDA